MRAEKVLEVTYQPYAECAEHECSWGIQESPMARDHAKRHVVATGHRVRVIVGRLMAWGKPPAIRVCSHQSHPARRHGHYGYGGAHWCSDFRSPLLSEENMGHVERGWIVIFEKPSAS